MKCIFNGKVGLDKKLFCHATQQIWKIMKLMMFLLTVLALQVSARGFGQTITFHSKEKITVEKALNIITQKMGYSFIGEKDILNNAPTITLSLKKATLTEALNQCLKGLPLTYDIEGKIVVLIGKVVLTKRMTALANESAVEKPDTVIHGRVTDNAGKPLVGVTIQVKGTTTGTTTNVDGNFNLDVRVGSVLEISYLGYYSKEIFVGRNINNSNLKILLSAATTELNQLVVTGYSSQLKKDITGSVDVVNMKAINAIPAGTGAQALQGQASGVTIINSGVPGGTSNIFIRGITSFGNTSPLVLIDGVPSSIEDIDPNNIASIQVLKDAGAASIYGVRGSNGVILITTKEGSGVPKVTYNGYYGYQFPPAGNVFNIANPVAEAKFIFKMDPNTELFPNGVLPDYTYTGPGISGIGNMGDLAVAPSLYTFNAANPSDDYLIQKINKSGTDWFHEIFRPAPEQSHNLSVRGGSNVANYFFSIGYLNQEGTLLETSLKRYSVRINTKFKILKNIRIGENAYVFYKENPPFQDQAEVNGIYAAAIMPNFIPAYDIKGHYGGTWLGPSDIGVSQNPLANRENTADNRANTWDVVGNVFAEVNILRHFQVKTSFGGTLDNQYYYVFSPNQYQDKQQHDIPNKYNENALYNSSWIWTNTINYQDTIGKQDIKIFGGSETINNYGRGVGGSSSDFFSQNPNYLILGNGTSNITNYSNAHSDALFSLFAKLEYSYSDKYLFTATVRRDGSSKFGSQKRFGIFPSFSAGWRISNEAFMQNVHWIDNLTLRGSWGVMGSQNNVSSNNAFSLYSSGFRNSYYDISGTNNPQQGFYQSTIGNPMTGWERDVESDFGIDATLFNYSVDLSLDRYNKSINGLLFPLPLPATAGGASAPIVNIGDIRNTGWDASLTYHGRISNNFRYDIKTIFTSYKNMIVKLPDPGYFDVNIADGGAFNYSVTRNEVGHPVGSFFGYRVIGYFQDSGDVKSSPSQDGAAPGLLKYEDVNKDGVINADDRTFIGNPNPKFTYGVNLDATYRRFDVGIILYGSQGNDVYNAFNTLRTLYNSRPQAISNDIIFNSWSPDNPHPKVPIPQNSSNFSQGNLSSFYVENGSFLKCRSLILGYSFSSTLVKHLNISKLRVYVQSTNLFQITSYSGLDPELMGSSEAFGIDASNYPNNFKAFLLGINLSF